jgi:hypothetical protein
MGIFDTLAALRNLSGLQERMHKLQEELGRKTAEGVVGGGLVKAVVNGRRELISLTIKPEAVKPDDVEMLEDLVVAAVNQAIARSTELVKEEVTKATGGMNLPGMDKLPG